MGKPKQIKAAQVGTNYNWGNFGSADSRGANLSQMGNANVQAAQMGTTQYLNELLNPSYNNESFRARQDILDASNRQFANEMGASAIERGARGSATQNILNSIAANRNNDMRIAMTDEDARVRAILAGTQGVEAQGFNQLNTMSDNILRRALANQSTENAANQYNTANYNNWRMGLINGGLGLGSSILSGGLGYLLAPTTNITGNILAGVNRTDPTGIYGAY